MKIDFAPSVSVHSPIEAAISYSFHVRVSREAFSVFKVMRE